MEQPAPLRTSAFSAQAAWQLVQLHRPTLALEMADRLLARNPSDIPALAVRTEALRLLNRLPEALIAAKEAVAQAPQSSVVFHRVAVILGQSGKLREAESAVREAIRLNPNDATYYGFLAQLNYLLARPDEAIANASAGLACNARNTNCLLWRAIAYERRSQPAAADADFRLALRLLPTSALLHQHRGNALLERAKPAGAAQHLAEALRLNPAAASALLPPLRRATRWQYWPLWMVRRHQRLRHEWQQQHTLWWADTGTALLLPFFLLLSWWHTRHEPLFQLSRAQVLRRWLKLWVGGILLLPVVIFLAGHFSLANIDTPLSMPQMIGLAVGGSLYQVVGYMLRRRLNQQLDA